MNDKQKSSPYRISVEVEKYLPKKKSLRCRLGLHKLKTSAGMFGAPFTEVCVLCGQSWLSM